MRSTYLSTIVILPEESTSTELNVDRKIVKLFFRNNLAMVNNQIKIACCVSLFLHFENSKIKKTEDKFDLALTRNVDILLKEKRQRLNKKKNK